MAQTAHASQPDEAVDVVVVGGGPAGHTAAVYAARAGLAVVLFEGPAPGGQLTTTTDVENFPGFPPPASVTGPELMERLRAQSSGHGARIDARSVARLDLSRRPFAVWPEGGGDAVLARTLIVATGATARRLDIAGGDALWQRGISACAVCDGAAPIFRGKPVAVVGGGDTAAEEALFLARRSSPVLVLVRGDRMRASAAMQARLAEHPAIHVVLRTRVLEARADACGTLGAIVIEQRSADGGGARTRTIAVSGLFYAIGHAPATALVAGQLRLDADGYIALEPGSDTRTNVPGVFACGDVCDRRYRQAITAAASGCKAALDAARFLDDGH